MGQGKGLHLIPVPLTDPAGLQKVFLSCRDENIPSIGSVKRLFIKCHRAGLEKMDPLPFICLTGFGSCWGL